MGGRQVLPAYHAMKSEQSVRFVIYILLWVVAVSHSYYSLPLPLSSDSLNTPFWIVSALRMFRLSILGDFDMSELEGSQLKLDPDTQVIEADTGPIHMELQCLVLSFSAIL